jgi:hypothetical protein
LVGRALARDEAVGQPIAGPAFRIVNAVIEQGSRVAELLGPYRLGPAPRKPWWRLWRQWFGARPASATNPDRRSPLL